MYVLDSLTLQYFSVYHKFTPYIVFWEVFNFVYIRELNSNSSGDDKC